ncbi:MAG: NAD-dependent epimerase/dehydratase family protein [Anaerolineales bacterium]|nr:NAD-dependent epimerase/dehydratase family protein [Anaerolineales bacterium]
MKLLILGGTIFLGRQVAEAALARGHTVTLFNRGRRNPDLFPEVEKLRGDRDGGLDVLRGRRWDAVIDPSGYVPRLVRAAAELLAGAAEHYTFISSLSVYADNRQLGITESYPVGRLADESVEQITAETYGPLKALCEQAAEAALPGRVLTVRAGLIVGPHDPTDRFTYWPARVARGGEVLAPGRPDYRVQFVDVRDLAGWIVRAVEARVTGVFNATGPEGVLTLGELLAASQAISGADTRLTWAAEPFLLEQKVVPWSELPLWIPDSDPDAAGFSAFDCGKALAAGLTFRPLAETVRDTLTWAAARPAEHAWRAGLPAEREAELLRLWHAQ